MKVPLRVRKEDNKSPKARTTKKQMKKKSHKNLQRSIIKSNRNMAKGVKGRAWCKNKKTKVRPMTKDILKMIILVAYKDVPTLELQRLLIRPPAPWTLKTP